MKVCSVVEWGITDYAQACAWQHKLVAARKAGAIPDILVLCEHPHMITLGRNARRENLRLPESELARRGVAVHRTDRGGDVTYHGPGQLVGYPILDLAELRKDVVWYVQALEEVLIRVAGEFGIAAERLPATQGKAPQAGAWGLGVKREGSPGRSPSASLRASPGARCEEAGSRKPVYTGVWVGEEKLAAIGVHISRWVTSHGFAFNVATDLSYFDLIVPCGLADKQPTSLLRLRPELTQAFGGQVSGLMAAVKQAVGRHFGAVFGRELEWVENWAEWLASWAQEKAPTGEATTTDP